MRSCCAEPSVRASGLLLFHRESGQLSNREEQRQPFFASLVAYILMILSLVRSDSCPLFNIYPDQSCTETTAEKNMFKLNWLGANQE